MSERESELLRNDIAKQIIALRLTKKLTQGELAERIGTKRSNISRIESGNQNISLDLLSKLSAALEADIEINLKERQAVNMINEYSLKIYNTKLIGFTLREKGIEGLVAEITYINEEEKHLLPLDLELSSEGILKWLQRRVIPKNRAFVDEILRSLNLSINDTKGIIDVCKGLSLNDSFWVVPKGFEGKFSEYNLYENRFSKMLSLVAYTGLGQSHEAFSTSPELTTGGMLPKGWRFIAHDGIYLYKGGTSGAANTGNEPYSEFYAYQVAKRMGLNAVEYDLEKWKGILASKCKLFTDIDTAFVPIGRIVSSGGLSAVMKYYETLGTDFYEQAKSMLIFDALIYNEDRHFGNFGLLRDNHTGKITAPAPIFDNGLSLFNYAMQSDMEDLDSYAKTRGTPFGNVTHETIAAEYIGKTQLKQLRNMIGFTFERHARYNLPEERLTAIEAHLQKRAAFLIRLEKVKHKSSPER